MQLNILLIGLATAAMALPSSRLAGRSEIQSNQNTTQDDAKPDASIGTAGTDNRDMRRDNGMPAVAIDKADDSRNWRRDNHVTADSVRITGTDDDDNDTTAPSVRITGTDNRDMRRDA